MTHLVARRKNKCAINIENDYFIFGVYPNNPSFFMDHFNTKNVDYSENSFNIKNKAQNQTIISHFYNQNGQLCFVMFSQNDDTQSHFITQIDDTNSINPQKEKYMKELVQIKTIPLDTCQTTSPLIIVNTKISSFSPKNEALVLSDIQYKISTDFLKLLKENRFGKLSVQINPSNYHDLCFIPVSISHLYIKNNFNGPFLIIAKNESTVELLYEQFNQWTLFKSLILLGNNDDLNFLQKIVFPFVPGRLDTVKYHVALTTTSVFTRNRQHFTSIAWNVVTVIDNQKSCIQTMQSCSHFGINITGVIEQ